MDKYRMLDGASRRILTIRTVQEIDSDPDLSWLEQSDADMGDGFEAESRARIDAYRRDEWYMVGTWAEATIVVRNTMQTIRTGGLWGIESDSGQPYLDDVAAEQRAELVTILHDLGFSGEEIANA